MIPWYNNSPISANPGKILMWTKSTVTSHPLVGSFRELGGFLSACTESLEGMLAYLQTFLPSDILSIKFQPLWSSRTLSSVFFTQGVKSLYPITLYHSLPGNSPKAEWWADTDLLSYRITILHCLTSVSCKWPFHILGLLFVCFRQKGKSDSLLCYLDRASSSWMKCNSSMLRN